MALRMFVLCKCKQGLGLYYHCIVSHNAYIYILLDNAHDCHKIPLNKTLPHNDNTAHYIHYLVMFCYVCNKCT